MKTFADDITLITVQQLKINTHDPSEAELENAKKQARNNRMGLQMKKFWLGEKKFYSNKKHWQSDF